MNSDIMLGILVGFGAGLFVGGIVVNYVYSKDNSDDSTFFD